MTDTAIPNLFLALLEAPAKYKWEALVQTEYF